MELSNCPVRINDGLFLGDEDTACDLEFFAANVIVYVVNCSEDEVSNFFEDVEIRGKQVQYLSWHPDLSFDTGFDPGPIESCYKLEAFLRNAEADGASCLIHSKNGAYRAVCATCILLMLRFHWSAKKTLEFIIARLPDVMLNKSFIRQLIFLEKKLQAEKNVIFSHGWNDLNLSKEEQLISNTFKNSCFTNRTDVTSQSYVECSSSCPSVPPEPGHHHHHHNHQHRIRKVQWKDEEKIKTPHLDPIIIPKTNDYTIVDDCSTDCDSPGFADELKPILNPGKRLPKDRLPIFHRIKSPFKPITSS